MVLLCYTVFVYYIAFEVWTLSYEFWYTISCTRQRCPLLLGSFL